MQNNAKWRTVKKCLDEIKGIDKDTAITEWFIRRLCDNGKVNCMKNGRKIFVNLDSLMNYLNGGYKKENVVHEK